MNSKNGLDFGAHVKLTLREKRPNTGAYLIQTTSTNLPKIVDVIRIALEKEGIDIKDRPINGHVRILFQLQSKGKCEEIHTYDTSIAELYKIITRELSLIDGDIIHGSYSDKVMNKNY